MENLVWRLPDLDWPWPDSFCPQFHVHWDSPKSVNIQRSKMRKMLKLALQFWNIKVVRKNKKTIIDSNHMKKGDNRTFLLKNSTDLSFYTRNLFSMNAEENYLKVPFLQSSSSKIYLTGMADENAITWKFETFMHFGIRMNSIEIRWHRIRSGFLTVRLSVQEYTSRRYSQV